MNVLFVDDEESMRALVRRIVTDAGYVAEIVDNGEEALKAFRAMRPDAVILDAMLPGMDGYDLCRVIREEDAAIPIIMLTARGGIIDKRIGFQSGADDYLVKPFEPAELLLRLEALYRRAKPKVVAASEDVAYGDLSIAFDERTVRLSGERVELTGLEFKLLGLLAESPGKTFSKDQIVREVWGDYYEGEQANLAVLIRRLREKVEVDPSNPKYIQTVWGVGYRFGD